MFEAVAALVLAIVGATVRSPPLREVTWRSEMKRRYVLLVLRHVVLSGPILSLNLRAAEEEGDPRMSFQTFARRAGIVPKVPSSS